MDQRHRVAIQFLMLTAVLLGVTSLPNEVESGIMGRRVCNRGSLPNYAYGQDSTITSGKVVTGDAVEEQVILVLESPRIQRHPAGKAAAVTIVKPAANSILANLTTTSAAPAAAAASAIPAPPGPITTQIPVTNGAGVAESVIVRRKQFAPQSPSLKLPNVNLSQMGFAIYETGHFVFTGMVNHTGGPDGLTLGNRVTVSVRGYGANLLAAPVAPTGPLLFETSTTFWLNRNDESSISLSPYELCERIRRHFDEVSHLEVKLSYRQDR